MSVSVIIPARNAAPTLAETLASLERQTYREWEAIVVDDGSTDDTAAIAGRYAERDARFRVVAQPPRGVGAARNRGLEVARRDWVVFLDGDDWLEPAHLERLTRAVGSDPSLDGAYCLFARVAEDGVLTAQDGAWIASDSLFAQFAHTCVWAIHACLVRRSLVERVGGFPDGWRTCEDWDLWQRITRTGARFGYVPETLALYRTRARSASMDAPDLLRGALRLVNQGHAPDPRVPDPHPEFARGLPGENASRARLDAVCWPAALLIGEGKDATALLDEVKDDRNPFLSPTLVASCVHEAAPLPSGGGRHRWPELLPEVEPALDRFLDALEAHSGAPRLARRAKATLEQLILAQRADRGIALAVGTTYATSVDVTAPIPEIRTAPGMTRLVCRVSIGERPIGSVHLPVCDGFVPAAVLADAIAVELAWPIAGCWLEEAIFGRSVPGRAPAAWLGRRLATRLGKLLGRKRADYDEWAFASLARIALAQEILAPPHAARVVPAPGDRVLVDIGEPLPDVVLEGRELVVELAFAGCPLGSVTLPAPERRVHARAIRRAIVHACGLELVRLAVREGILGRPFDPATPLREQLARTGDLTASFGADDVRRLYGIPSEPVLVLARRPRAGIGTSASRRSVLPSSTAETLRDLSFATGEPIVLAPARSASPPRVVYAPELAAPDASPAAPASVPSPFIRTLDVTTRLAQRALPDLRRRLGARALADRLPILMYHRIATEGPPSLAPYRVSPAAFDEQLRWLEAAGYRSVTLDDWRAAVAGRRTLRGKPILLTFDDGYRDFAAHAWPSLRARGFGALVLVVSELVGGCSEWDRPFGDVAPLLDWNEVLSLQAEGCEFGSHTATHPPLTSLDPAGIVEEVARSRAALERRLGRSVRAIAYPYGDVDPIVRHLTGACGYVFGLTCHSTAAQFSHPLLELPRIEVSGADSLERFVWKIEHRKWDAEMVRP